MLQTFAGVCQQPELSCTPGSLAASFSEAKALLMGSVGSAKEKADDNAVARNHARASHDLRASLNLDRTRPSMDQVPTSETAIDAFRCTHIVQ